MKKSGAWFTYEGEQLGQGRENAKNFLAENPEIMVEISDKVLIASGLKPDPDAPPPVEVFTPADEAPIDLDALDRVDVTPGASGAADEIGLKGPGQGGAEPVARNLSRLRLVERVSANQDSGRVPPPCRGAANSQESQGR